MLSDEVRFYWGVGCCFPGTGDWYVRFPVLGRRVACPVCDPDGSPDGLFCVEVRQVLHCALEAGWDVEKVIMWLKDYKLDHEEVVVDHVADEKASTKLADRLNKEEQCITKNGL